MRAFARVAAVAAAAGLFLAPAAGAASAAGPRPAAQVPIKSGTTRITTIDGIPSLLLASQITAFGTDPGTETLTDGTMLFAGPVTAAAPRTPAFRFTFPVIGGQVGQHSPSGHINHHGGILLADIANGRTVLIGRFTVDLGRKILTGIINGDPSTRMTLFRLDVSHARVHVRGRTISVSNVGLKITSAAITALDTALSTTSLTGLSKFGSLSTTLRF